MYIFLPNNDNNDINNKKSQSYEYSDRMANTRIWRICVNSCFVKFLFRTTSEVVKNENGQEQWETSERKTYTSDVIIPAMSLVASISV